MYRYEHKRGCEKLHYHNQAEQPGCASCVLAAALFQPTMKNVFVGGSEVGYQLRCLFWLQSVQSISNSCNSLREAVR